jgi:hypothetical protein
MKIKKSNNLNLKVLYFKDREKIQILKIDIKTVKKKII